MTVTQTHPTFDMREKVQVGLFTPAEIDLYWPQIEHMLNSVPHTWEGYSVAFFHESVKNGNVQVWGAGKEGSVFLVYFTNIMLYPAKKTLQVGWAGGKIENFLPAINASLEQFAKEQDCDEVEILGRAGWEKLMMPFGFRKRAVYISRPVDKGRLQ